VNPISEKRKLYGLPWQLGVAALLAVALRLWLLGDYGILFWPDSTGYIDHAKTLLHVDTFWQLFTPDTRIPSFRIVGYPVVIAVMMLVGGEFWPWYLVALQIMMSLLAMWWLFRFGRALGFGQGFSAFAAGVFICSHVAMYDGSILTDSLFTYIVLIGLLIMLIPLIEGRPVGLGRALFGGLFVALSIMIREATVYLIPILALGFVVVMQAQGIPYGRMVAILVGFFVPAIVFVQAYSAWNEMRTGHRLITTVGQSVYLLHPLDIEKRGNAVFRDPVLREAVDATGSYYTYGHALEINEYLMKKGMDEWERAKLSEAAYWDAWLTHPGAMTGEFFRELRLKFAIQLADPSLSLRYYPVVAGRVESVPRERGIVGPVLTIALRCFSAAIFIGCVLGIPLGLLRKFRQGAGLPHLDALIFCWLVFVGMMGMYAIIHLEFRYTLPAQALAIVSGLAMLRHYFLLAKAWRRRTASRA
jgi:hypothetical protein